MRNLVHLKHDGSLYTNWVPDPDGEVRCMALNGSNRLFIGGKFGNVYNFFRYNLACVDTSTGIPDQWSPYSDSAVYCMQLDAQVHGIYVGGAFTTIGGALRNHLARLDTTNGFVFLYPSQPNVDFNFTTDGNVYALYVTTNKVFFGGSFSSVASLNRQKVACITTFNNNPAVANWNPAPNGIVYALSPDSTNHILY